MAGVPEPATFGKARKAGRTVVDELPKFDLDAYIANYKGRTRFKRLLLIGTSSTILYHDALKAAIAEAKSGYDTQQYQQAVSMLRECDPMDREGTLDLVWIDKLTKQTKVETDKLEMELKGYKNNLIKESIRMGYDDLGQHYQRIGDLASSIKAYAKMRDFCTTNAHIVIMTMHMINVSIQQANWHAVQSQISRVRNGGPNNQKDGDKNSARLSAAMGVSYLALGNYDKAAQEFLGMDPRMAGAKMDDPTDEESYNEVLTPNDVAVYGGLCALASMSREELQSKVLDHKTFRNYLELEPHIRRAISHFVSAKYSACLSILDSYAADYLLDVYMQPHVQAIYFKIRSKAIQQYFIPFSCVTFSALATAFNTDEASIEVELTTMIKSGNLDARLDLVDRVLLAVKKDGRAEVHAEAVATAKEYEKTLRLRLLRMQVLNAGLEVRGPRSGLLGTPGLQDPMMFNGSAAGDLAD